MMHLEKAKALCEKAGLSLDDCVEEMNMGEKESEDEGEDMGEEEDSKPMMNKGKIALIVAKMKNRNAIEGRLKNASHRSTHFSKPQSY
jgi:hypothetical protein